MTHHQVYCNRTLNLRSIRAIGYDMDYTLVEYCVEEWERRVHEFARERLAEKGWPTQELRFDPTLAIRGLIIDTELGNLVKANRFGYVQRAYHGTNPLSFEEQRRIYARTMVDLAEKRFVFLNTLFSISEACIYAQLVDLLDEGRLPLVLGYAELYRQVRNQINEAHVEGRIKAEIVQNPGPLVPINPEIALTLLDQKHAGKKLLLITNADWPYAKAMMDYNFNPFLPPGMVWKDLFDLVVVAANKPEFFMARSTSMYEVVSEDGLLRPVRSLKTGAIHVGGCAIAVEEHLGISSDEILYVGDHLYADVHVTKSILRWRTALILAELSQEIEAAKNFEPQEARLRDLMAEKTKLEAAYCQAKLQQQRLGSGYGPTMPQSSELSADALKSRLKALDLAISPLAKASSELGNHRWGLLMRTGNDKSYLARQMERYADIYMGSVSDLLSHTPYAYWRSFRGSLPHDIPVLQSRGLDGNHWEEEPDGQE